MRTRPTLSPTSRLPALVALLVLGLGTPAARGGGDTPVPSAAGGLVLDGALAEPEWESAARLFSGAVEVPVVGRDDRRLLDPEVRLLTSRGALWMGVRAEEPAGAGIGLVAMLAPRGTASAADALTVAYSPRSPGVARFVVRGPRGVGRGVYRVDGECDVGDGGRWSVEVAVPLADLGLASPDAALRLAVAVRTRDPGLLVWAPPEAAFAGPDAWALLQPSGGAWAADPAAAPEAAALAEADRRDEDHLAAWRSFLAADQRSVEDLLDAAGALPPLDDPDARGRALAAALADPARLRAAAHASLLVPLDEVLEARPDLALAAVARGDVLARLGEPAEAEAAFADALRRSPGLPEARFGTWLEVRGPGVVTGESGGPTSWEAAERRLAALEASVGDDPVARDGAAFGAGLLAYLRGDFETAAARLEKLAARYPWRATVVKHAERARAARAEWPREQQRRAAEDRQGDTPSLRLPRLRITTSRGEVDVDLLEDLAPNAVRHLVWLATHRFYDGTGFDRTVPYLGVFGGAPPEGAGEGPGYALPAEQPAAPAGGREVVRRRLFRGDLVLVSPSAAAEGVRFLLLTGTALHLDEDRVPVGRVVRGQEVVDALVAGDRVLSVEALRTRPGVEYRPLTVEGGPAPAPRR